MARPIQNTPIIRGKDAKAFRSIISESLTKTLSKKEKKAQENELKEMKECYDLLVSISEDGAFY